MYQHVLLQYIDIFFRWSEIQVSEHHIDPIAAALFRYRDAVVVMYSCCYLCLVYVLIDAYFCCSLCEEDPCIVVLGEKEPGRRSSTERRGARVH
jgi:hypothetical protein